MAIETVIITETNETVTLPSQDVTSIVITGGGPQGPPGVGLPVFFGTVAPTTSETLYIWFKELTDGSYQILVEDGT